MFGFIEQNLFLLTVLGVVLVFYYSKKLRIFYYGSKFNGPFALPFIGNALMFIGSQNQIHKRVVKFIEKYKSPWRIYVGHTLFICISEPEQVEVILNTPNALNKGENYNMMKSFFGEGLLTASGSTWKQHRKIISPAFNPKLLNDFFQIFSEESEKLAKNLEKLVNDEYFDVFPVINESTLHMTCETNLGMKTENQTEMGDYVQNMSCVLNISCKRMYNIWLRSDLIFKMTAMGRVFKKSRDEMFKFCEKIIEARKEILHHQKSSVCDDENRTLKPFLDRLIELSAKENKSFTNEQLTYEVNTFAATGSETSATTTSFVLLMLGMHQNIQEEVFGELKEIFGESGRSVSLDDLPKMKILERVIKETLRLFPVGPVFSRNIDEDVKMGSYLIPKGSVCVIIARYLHRNPKFWQNPLKFDPDRFLPEKIQNRHPYCYVPFSAGPRSCIGQKYAMMGMKAILSTVLRKYKFFTNYKTTNEIKLGLDITLKASDGFNVKIEKRV